MKIKSSLKWVSFAIYIFFLVWLVIFKLSSPFDINIWFHRRVDFIPFYFDANTSRMAQLKEMVYNVIAFIPLGTYFSMVFKGWSFKKRILAAFLVSFTFEIVQFAFALGISDITDLITNTLGALMGIGSYYLLAFLFKSKADNVIIITMLVFEIFFGGFFLFLTLANLQ